MEAVEISQDEPTISNSPATAAVIAENVKAQYSERVAGKRSDSRHNDDGTAKNTAIVTCDFLRFIPDNEAAQLAFHELACKKQNGDLSPNHAHFVSIQSKGRLIDEAGYDCGISGEGTSAESSEEQRVGHEDIHKGYFAVNLDYETITRGTKWILGRGSRKSGPDRNVDILLAAPGSRYQRHLAPAHAFLRMNLQSGAWTLTAGQECSHATQQGLFLESVDFAESSNVCSHTPVWIDGHALKHFQYECLSRPRTSFVVGGLRYVAQYIINNLTLEESYIRERNTWLQERALHVPATDISCIPFQSDLHTTFAVFRQGLGSGTFGTVFEGFEPLTGDLRAIKKLVLKSDFDRPEVDSELAVHEEFKNTTGVVRFYGCRNSLGGDNTEAKTEHAYPLEVFIIMEKGTSFLDYFRRKQVTIDGAWRKLLCKQLLTGLAAIHSKSWMHRDITPKNVLYFDQEPAHAGLCDFGKLCRSTADNVTTLAAWRWLPPEIVENQRRTYNQKIDVWMLGYTLLYCWYYDYQYGMELRNARDHAIVLKRLSNDRDRHLPQLLVKMLAFNPASRLSAQEALADPCLAEVVFATEPEALKPARKRPAG